jgi:hypothetical protein
MVSVSPNDSFGIDGLAGFDLDSAHARLLIGNNDSSGQNIRLVLKNIQPISSLVKDGKVHVMAEYIPHTHFNPCDSIGIWFEDAFEVSGDSVVVPIAKGDGKGAFALTVTRDPLVGTLGSRVSSTPASSRLMLHAHNARLFIERPGTHRVRMFNLRGETVFSARGVGRTQYALPVHSLADGIYQIRIENRGTVETLRCHWVGR